MKLDKIQVGMLVCIALLVVCFIYTIGNQDTNTLPYKTGAGWVNRVVPLCEDGVICYTLGTVWGGCVLADDALLAKYCGGDE